ncbi:MAG: TonB-dependent receptor [Chthoniobacteraceae bacterium]
MLHHSVVSHAHAPVGVLPLEGHAYPLFHSRNKPIALAACLLSSTLVLSGMAEEKKKEAPESATVVTEEVIVTGSVPQNGSAEAGYRVDSASVGPLGNMKLQDTPFSISVVSSDLIENLQASTPTEALRYDPTIQPALASNRSSDYFMIRGFVSSLNSNSTAVDGMRTYNLAVPVEDKQQIEVMAGANSFLYGITSPGGMVNYILKRPTATPLANVTMGDYGGSQFYTHGDFGGALDKAGKVTFRLNAVYADDGSMAISDQTHERSLISGALDWRMAPDTVLSFDASHFQRNLDHQQAIFLIGSGKATKINGVTYSGVTTVIPDAPDASKNYGSPFCYAKDSYNQYGTEFTSKLSDIFTIRSAFRYNEAENENPSLRNQFLDDAGHFNEVMYVKGKHQTNTTQGNFFLDSTFETGAISHKVTLGYAQDYVENLNPYPDQNLTYTTDGFVSSLSDPTYASYESFKNSKGKSITLAPISSGRPYRTTDTTNYRTILLGDQIELSEKWGLLLGATVATIENQNWAVATGDRLPGVNQTALTPTAALTFKPIPCVTTYASYIESLQNAGTVPTGYGYRNENAALSPYLARQEEIGIKTTVGEMNLTTALFRIDKAAYTVTQDNYYTEGGTEVHQGVEFTATGKVTPDWTISGGFTLLNAEIEDQRTNKAGTSLSGKTPDGVPEQVAKLYTEYAIPFVPGLSLVGGISYVGREFVDSSANHNMDTMTIPAVVTGEVGARYKANIRGHDVTLRFNVTNVTGENYWTTKGDNMLYLGEPRTFAFSAELAWF